LNLCGFNCGIWFDSSATWVCLEQLYPKTYAMAEVDNEQYLTAHKVFKTRSIDENRFIDIENRDTQSVLTAEMAKILCHGKSNLQR
jgi:hypothetical protein